MLAIQPVARAESDEELRAVGIRSRIGHGQVSALEMPNVEVLIGEFEPVDGLAALTIAVSEVAALGHEAVDDAMEAAVFEVQWLPLPPITLLSSAQSPKILSSARTHILVELHGDAAGVGAANFNVEKYLRVFSISDGDFWDIAFA